MFIYKIQNTLDSKVYIGQTRKTDAYLRWKTHKKQLNSNTHPNHYLQSAWNKYGKNVFIFSIIQTCNNIDDLDDAETVNIIEYKSCNRDYGYNLNFGGDSKAFCLEVRQKISKACKGKKNGFYGKKHTEETKKILSQKSIGRKQSLETIEKKRQAQLGKKHNKIWRTNISKSLVGKKKSSEHIKHMSESQKGKIIKEETKQKISKSMLGKNNPFYGKKHTEETKEKMRQAKLKNKSTGV